MDFVGFLETGESDGIFGHSRDLYKEADVPNRDLATRLGPLAYEGKGECDAEKTRCSEWLGDGGSQGKAIIPPHTPSLLGR